MEILARAIKFVSTFETFSIYLIRVLPALLLAVLMFWLVRRTPRLRIVLYLALFVLARDVMTPLELWRFGGQGFFWMRLFKDPWFLVVFGLLCLGIALALYFLDAANRPLFRWIRGNPLLGFTWGIVGMLIVVAPLAIPYMHTDMAARGGYVATSHLPAILVFALLGNLLEEALFRGYVLGWFAEQTNLIEAGIASGVVFAFCHIYLAITVSDIGYPLLAFTLWEGVIAGLVGARGGVLPATLTHGGAIFVLVSGVI